MNASIRWAITAATFLAFFNAAEIIILELNDTPDTISHFINHTGAVSLRCKGAVDPAKLKWEHNGKPIMPPMKSSVIDGAAVVDIANYDGIYDGLYTCTNEERSLDRKKIRLYHTVAPPMPEDHTECASDQNICHNSVQCRVDPSDKVLCVCRIGWAGPRCTDAIHPQSVTQNQAGVAVLIAVVCLIVVLVVLSTTIGISMNRRQAKTAARSFVAVPTNEV